MADTNLGRKRQREAMPTVSDLMVEARTLWRDKNPHLRSTAQQEDRKFRESFGCGPLVALTGWTMLVRFDLLPSGGTLQHYLWTLAFLKQYGKTLQLCQFCGCDGKTLRTWTWRFLYALSELEPYVVSDFVVD